MPGTFLRALSVLTQSLQQQSLIDTETETQVKTYSKNTHAVFTTDYSTPSTPQMYFKKPKFLREIGLDVTYTALADLIPVYCPAICWALATQTLQSLHQHTRLVPASGPLLCLLSVELSPDLNMTACFSSVSCTNATSSKRSWTSLKYSLPPTSPCLSQTRLSFLHPKLFVFPYQNESSVGEGTVTFPTVSPVPIRVSGTQ